MIETMYPAAVNSRQTELAEAIEDTQTSFTVLDGSVLPPAPNQLTLGTDESAETIKYTGKTGNEITGVTRGFEGAAKSWAAGTKLARYFTAYDHNTFKGNIADLNERLNNIPAPQDASLTVKGIVQLSNKVNGTSQNLAATEKAVNDTRLSIVNDYIRQPGYAVTSGSATAYVATLDPVPASLPAGFGITIVPHVASGASPTLNINGLGAITLKKQDGSTFAAGDLKVNTPYTFRKVGSDFLADSGGGEVLISGQTEQVVTYAETITANDPIYTKETYLNNTTISGGYPPGPARSLDWSPDGIYLAVSHNASPYLSLYKRTGNVLTKLPNPALLPTNIGLGCGFSPDGAYLAVAHATAPFLTIYKRSGDVFTKLADPSVLPTNESYAIAWSPDGVYLAVGQNNTPFINIYKRSGDTFTRLTNPSTLPPAIAYGAAFSPDGVYLAFAHATSPFMTIYKRSGDVFTKLADPSILPPGNTVSVAWSVDGLSVAFGSAAAPYITIYSRSGDTFTKSTNPTELPSGTVNGIKYSPDGEHLSLAFTGSPYLINYRIRPDSYSKLANPVTLPPGNSNSLGYPSSGAILAVASGSANYLIVYNYSTFAYKSNNNADELLVASTAGYALESGSAGDSKKAVIIWR